MTTAIKTKYANGVFQPLETVDLPEGFDVTVYLEDAIPIIDNETREWLDGAAEGMANRLAELESEMPKAQVKNWHEAMSRAAKPARYIEGKGVVLKQEA